MLRKASLVKKLDHYISPGDIEGIFIEINLRKTKWLLYGSYHPPSQSDEYFLNHLEKAIDIYSNFYTNFLLIGDFNIEDHETCLFNFLYFVKGESTAKRIENGFS